MADSVVDIALIYPELLGTYGDGGNALVLARRLQRRGIENRVLPTTQRYGVFLDVALPEGREVMPGLTGEVSIIVAERPNAVTVPRRALIYGLT